MNKFITVILSVLILSFVACDRYIESRDPVRSLSENVAVPQNVQLFVNDRSVSLTWEISDTAAISLYRIYVSEIDTLNYKLEDTTSSFSITLDQLSSNRLYFFKVAAVSTSGLEGYLSDELFAQIGVLSMVLSNDREYTNRQDIQVQFAVSNSVSNVQLSEDSTFANAVYEQFGGQIGFRLSDGDGVKRVYARLLFSNGSTNSVPLQDSILLDTEARIDSVFFLSPNSLFRPGDTIVFGLFASETKGTARVSFNGSGTINLSDDGTDFDPVADDGNYYGWYVVPTNTNVFNVTVTGTFSDQAGNNAPNLASFDLLNINTTPEQIELLVTYTPGDSAYFSWTRSSEPDFESYRMFTDVTSNVLFNDELVTYESNINTREFTFMPASGTTYYRIFVFDVHGNYSVSDAVQIVSP